MRKMLAVVCLLCGSLLWGQTQQQIQANVTQAGPQPEAKAPLSKKAAAEKKQQEERAMRMLEVAAAEAAGLEGGMRAYAFRQLARAYQRTDKAKALELLDGAMTATADMEDEGSRTRAELQQHILRDMVPLDPNRAEELLAQVPAESREPVLNTLLGYYEKNKNFDHALELVYRIGQEKEIPYQSAVRIMTALPPERSGDLLQLFTASFSSYRDHAHSDVMMGGDDFSTMVVKFWQKLPLNQVHDAIDELLKQAADRSDTKINMTSDNGSAAFNSLYEYRLFELLPVLRQIDPAQADELLKKNQETKALLAKYPEGMGSLAPQPPAPSPASSPDADKPARKQGMGTSFSVSSGSARMTGADAMMLQQQQSRRILAEADEHPENALTQVASLTNADLRANTYLMIAQSAAKKKPSVARSAIEKLLGGLDQVRPLFQVNLLRSAADLYLQMSETEDAKKVVERGFKLADNLQATDTNADDPNKALKAYWPSAEAWRSFTRLAGQISAPWATTLVNEISDPDMKVMAQTALAQQWLDVSRGNVTIMSNSKQGNMTMMSSEDRQ